MKDKEQNINLWGFKDILMTIGYLSCWSMIMWGLITFFCFDGNEFITPVIVQLLITLMIFGVVYYFAIKKANNTLSAFLGAHIQFKNILIASLMASLLLVLSTSLISFGVFESTGEQAPNVYGSMKNNYLLLFSSFAVLISPFSEEVFFRGFLQPLAVKKWGVWLGIFATAIVFSLSHFQYIGYISTFLGILAVGLILGYLKEHTNSLIPCILAHFLNNVIAVYYLIGA